MIDFLKGIAVFSGTIIGVGIFGLPYVASKVGFPSILFYFLFLTAIILTVHLMYTRVSLQMNNSHQFPGAVGTYMGPKWKKFTFVTTSLGLVGALLAYLIVGGNFLHLLLSPFLGGSVLLYTLLFFALGSIFVFKGVKDISIVELLLLAVFLIILGVFFVKSFPYINIDYLKTTDLRFFVMPYGVILFSLWGSSVIPEVKNVVKGNAKILKSVIIAGTFLAALVYLLFIFMIFGVTGPETSKEAILGMTNVLGSEVVKFGFIFGIITCFTSFITLGLTLKNILFCDFGMKKNLSWLIACLTPLLLFFLGAREFINIIGLTGTFTVGIMGIIIVFLYKEFLKKKLNKKINPLAYLLPAAFIIGVALEIFSFFTENIS